MDQTQKAYFFGFSRWKHGYIKPFLPEYNQQNLFFINPLFRSHYVLACQKGLDKNSHIYIWGRKSFPEIEAFAKENRIDIFRVEDGFIRSIGLGSDLTQPYSQVIDKKGIYFDPTCQSELEHILNTYDFSQDNSLLERAQKLQEFIIQNKISKYNADSNKELLFHTDKEVALVTGQVEDDASIKYGANGMTNLELLKRVKEKASDRYIVFKPHPDVLSGNRVGNIIESEALKYCDEVITNISMASALEAADEIHTMTSLTGFEAMLYGKKVFTYGMPFYAGWGLSTDEQILTRRTKQRTLLELIAATYILYPRYISPESKGICEVEEMIEKLQEQRIALESSKLLRVKFKFYSYLSRMAQKILSLVV